MNCEASGKGAGALRVSVVIPTFNRHEKLAETVRCVREQTLPAADYEIIVVDDGSTPPVVLADHPRGVPTSVIRLGGRERSAARNAGAAAARGELLVFVDNDVLLPPTFLESYLKAHESWSDALLVGAIRLPEGSLAHPFVRFRQALEDDGGTAAGLTDAKNFCAAGNMAIPRDRFRVLDGFDLGIVSGEDQDLALRHTSAGGRIAYVPEARVIHCDGALDVRGYCKRHEWGMEKMIPFCRRYPERADNRDRDRVNGPVRFGRESMGLSVRKLAKSALGVRPLTELLFGLCSALERVSPRPPQRLYRLLLGIHLQRGYRRGLKAATPAVAASVATGTV